MQVFGNADATAGFRRHAGYAIGFVNLKDFALMYGFGANQTFDLHDLSRGAVRTTVHAARCVAAKDAGERIHMALVIDEYGGTDGLVTIEDLLEQVEDRG
jgi:magnesium and cobalt transporter